MIKETKMKRNRQPQYTVDVFISHNYDDLMVKYEEEYPEKVYDQDGELYNNSFESNHYISWEYETSREIMEELYIEFLDKNAERTNPTEQAEYEVKQIIEDDIATEAKRERMLQTN